MALYEVGQYAGSRSPVIRARHLRAVPSVSGIELETIGTTEPQPLYTDVSYALVQLWQERFPGYQPHHASTMNRVRHGQVIGKQEPERLVITPLIS